MAARRSAASPALLPGALFLAALAAWPRIPQPPAYLAPTATNVEPSTASQAPAAEEAIPAAKEGWRQQDWRRRTEPRKRIRFVGQRLWGKVIGFAQTQAGGAIVNVGVGRPCLLMPRDWTRRLELGDRIDDLWVRFIDRDGQYPAHISMKPIRFRSVHLKKDDKLRGTVLRVTELGAFLDVGCTNDALLLPKQISPLVESIFRRPLEPGDQLDVWVMEVRQDLHFTVTTYGPRRSAESFKPGEKVTGVVRKTLPWGAAFMDVMATKDGYIDGEEFEDSDLYRVGDVAELYVQAYTKEKGLRLTLEKPLTRMETLKAGRKITGTVVRDIGGGGYAIDVGAVEDVLLNARDMTEEGVFVGENVTVWVKNGIGKSRRGSIQVTMREPKIPSQQLLMESGWLDGTVRSYNTVDDDGGVFVDIGWVKNALLRRKDFPPDLADKQMAEAFKIGEEVQVRVTNTHRDGQVDVTMLLEPEPRRGVV